LDNIHQRRDQQWSFQFWCYGFWRKEDTELTYLIFSNTSVLHQQKISWKVRQFQLYVNVKFNKNLRIMIWSKNVFVPCLHKIFSLKQYKLWEGSERQKSKHQRVRTSKVFRMIRMSKVKKITTSKDHNVKRSQHQKIITSKDKNIKSDLPMAFGLLNLT
jgi:hypothetical protein